jgi:YegS/Rv2252/BmrU family lipid kinase
MADYSKAILFFNPKSGNSNVGHPRELIQAHFSKHDISLETIIVPKPHNELEEIINSAIDEGIRLFLAAGGDGTVSMVGTHLVGKDIPIGIIPMGTGNLLSKAMRIPQKPDQALELITSAEHEHAKIDTFKMDGRFFLLNVSIGVSPNIMKSVDSQQKQQFGFFAYLINFIQQLLGLQLHRVSIECDDKQYSYMASEILITNIGTAGVEPLTWSEDILLNDGSLDLLVFRARNFRDIISLLISIFTKKGKMNPVVKFLKVNQYCKIDAQTPLHTQADGDVVGTTPFEVMVYPSSLSILVGKNCPINHEQGG